MSDVNILIDAMLDMQHPSEAQLSPNGETVAYVLGTGNKPGADHPADKAIHLIDVGSGEQRLLTGRGTGTNDLPRWSPDSRTLLFTSNRANPRESQLYQIDVGGGEAQVLTDVRGHVIAPQWSPDGCKIAFLFGENPPEADPVVVDAYPPFHHIWVLDLESGDLKQVSPVDQHVFEYVWSPDGAHFAVLTSPHPNPHESWYSAQLHVLTSATGEMRQVCAIDKQMGRLTWSPDGGRIAYLSCAMSDEGGIAGDIFVVAADGGQPRCLTPGIDYSIMWMEWRANGILYGARHVGATLLGCIDPDSGNARIIAEGLYTIGDSTQRVSAAQNGTFAAVRESFAEPPNVYLGSLDGGDWRRLTDIPVDPALAPLRVEERHWTATDGLPVQGFVLFPAGYVPGRRYPMFAHVHGGPSWSYSPRYGSQWERLLTARGCLVLMPNPRGSWGRGSAYQSANIGDLGGGDWQDINAGVDLMIGEGLADPERLAIGGWSYGGYLVTWAVTQTDRFRCAIAGASITNYESNYGLVPNREWQTTMFGSYVYDDERHRARSPLTHVKQVKTPTLLVHGEQDILAPVGQAIEFYVALRHFGVPTQLIIYPREPHGFQERPHQRDMLQRITGWLDRYLP